MGLELEATEVAAKTELSAKLQEQWGKVDDAVRVYNETVTKARAELESVVSTFNEIAGTAKQYADNVWQRLSDDSDANGEDTTDGDTSMLDEWEGFDTDGIKDIDWPEDLQIDEPGILSLDSLPIEAVDE